MPFKVKEKLIMEWYKYWGGIILISFLICGYSSAQWMLVPMDGLQTDHLKAYGLTYQALQEGVKVEWLLNYRGGSFLFPQSENTIKKAEAMGVYYELLPSDKAIRKVIEEENMWNVLLEKAPTIAVYVPPTSDPWDDAVRLALEYAEIPYSKVWDEEVLAGKLSEFDWLHLHHEDFTGQYGKFYGTQRNQLWYILQVKTQEEMAKKIGFKRVADLKGAVAKAIKRFVLNGGFLFAMCSATDTLDIALAADGIDIVPPEIDYTPIDKDADKKLNFDKTLAFKDFQLITDPYVYEFSTIDASNKESGEQQWEDFELFEFSAKYDPIPCMLNQNHTRIVKGFMGQTTSFWKKYLKEQVIILGFIPGTNRVKYLHGNAGKGKFTFLGGHDPEDFEHLINDPPTDLRFHKNSPGYRLILNNILFPAAKRIERKT